VFFLSPSLDEGIETTRVYGRAVTGYFGTGTGTLEIGKFSVILNKIGNPTEIVYCLGMDEISLAPCILR
jgi:hypothetical protein